MRHYAARGLLSATLFVALGAMYVVAQNPNPNPVPTPNPYPNPVQPPAHNPVPNPPTMDNPHGTATVAPTHAAPIARRAKQVLGSQVSLQGNIAIGTVDDIIFTDDGYIDYLVVINEGKYVIVPWQAAKFNFESRQATIAITQEKFREIPTYTTQTYGTVNFYEPQYVQRIYGYYGVAVPVRPGVDRRMDRRDDRKDRQGR